jgi:hypothetical protein
MIGAMLSSDTSAACLDDIFTLSRVRNADSDMLELKTMKRVRRQRDHPVKRTMARNTQYGCHAGVTSESQCNQSGGSP